MYRFGAPIFVIDGISLLSYILIGNAHERNGSNLDLLPLTALAVNYRHILDESLDATRI
jgi:hypothetical protein